MTGACCIWLHFVAFAESEGLNWVRFVIPGARLQRDTKDRSALHLVAN